MSGVMGAAVVVVGAAVVVVGAAVVVVGETVVVVGAAVVVVGEAVATPTNNKPPLGGRRHDSTPPPTDATWRTPRTSRVSTAKVTNE